MIRSAAVGRNTAPRRPHRGWAALLALLLVSCAPASETEIRLALSAPPNPAAEAGAPARFTNSEFVA
ncbi:MAG: hypothetical protein WA459_07445, partial [Stellaceae bacterium]